VWQVLRAQLPNDKLTGRAGVDYLNGSTHGGDPAKEQQQFISVNRLIAWLMLHDLEKFDYRMFALWTMRGALEYSEARPHLQSNMAYHLPAAASLIHILGPEIFQWDHEFSYGARDGDPGRVGPLLGGQWEGKHGFCDGRWRFWRGRLEELSVSKHLSNDFRTIAQRTHAKMVMIEENVKRC
jgi:hypothetical protein